jgi:hypothetical protein
MEGWPDAVFTQAVKAGAEVLSPMTNMFFGSREGRAKSSFVERYSFINAFNDDVGGNSVEPCWYRIDAHENPPLDSAIVLAAIAEGTLGAMWLRPLARFLTVLS